MIVGFDPEPKGNSKEEVVVVIPVEVVESFPNPPPGRFAPVEVVPESFTDPPPGAVPPVCSVVLVVVDAGCWRNEN